MKMLRLCLLSIIIPGLFISCALAAELVGSLQVNTSLEIDTPKVQDPWLPTLVSGMPSAINVLAATQSSIIISWLPPETPGIDEKLIHYEVYSYNSVYTPDIRSYEELTGDSITGSPKYTEIPGLCAGEFYWIFVAMIDQYGNTKLCAPINAVTMNTESSVEYNGSTEPFALDNLGIEDFFIGTPADGGNFNLYNCTIKADITIVEGSGNAGIIVRGKWDPENPESTREQGYLFSLSNQNMDIGIYRNNINTYVSLLGTKPVFHEPVSECFSVVIKLYGEKLSLLVVGQERVEVTDITFLNNNGIGLYANNVIAVIDNVTISF